MKEHFWMKAAPYAYIRWKKSWVVMDVAMWSRKLMLFYFHWAWCIDFSDLVKDRHAGSCQSTLSFDIALLGTRAHCVFRKGNLPFHAKLFNKL